MVSALFDMHESLDPAILDRYFTGAATPEEMARVERLLGGRDRIFEAADGGDSRASESDRWANLQAAMGDTNRRGMQWSSYRREVGQRTPRAGLFSKRTLRGWAVITACVAAVVLSVRSLVWPQHDSPVANPTTYTTRAAQRATVVLADGSRVILAPQTRLIISRDFTRTSRHVWLVGEAYFEVAHRPSIPFIVQTGPVSIQVAGTSFDIRHYQGDREVSVAVTTGKVIAKHGERSTLTLIAGTIGHITDSTATTETADDLAMTVGWTRGALVFHHTPLLEALATLGHWYGLELRVADTTMAHWHMSGTFSGESRAEALMALQATLDVGMTFNEVPGQPPIVTLVQRPTKPVRHPEFRDSRSFSHPNMEVGQ